MVRRSLTPPCMTAQLSPSSGSSGRSGRNGCGGGGGLVACIRVGRLLGLGETLEVRVSAQKLTGIPKKSPL